MNKSVWAMIAVAASVPLIWGGIQLRQSMACSGLEEDYLNIVSEIKSLGQTRSVISALGKPTEDIEGLVDLRMKDLGTAIEAIYTQCGSRAGRTASRKGSELLLS